MDMFTLVGLPKKNIHKQKNKTSLLPTPNVDCSIPGVRKVNNRTMIKVAIYKRMLYNEIVGSLVYVTLNGSTITE
jgi:hypothetical protein